MGELREYCGVFGIFGHPQAAKLTYYGLLALQHRGQEGAGMAVVQGDRLRMHKRPGLVSEAFNPAALKQLQGNAAIGQTLYLRRGLTAAASELQPLMVNHRCGDMAFCYNGALTNAAELRHELEEAGSIFHTHVDIEVVVHLMARHHRQPAADALARGLNQLKGAYSGLWLTPEQLLAARDPHGFRPLSLGQLEWREEEEEEEEEGGGPASSGTAWVLASETCALDTVGAEFVRDVEPGELLTIDAGGLRSTRLASPPRTEGRLCSFEFVYFARPDSVLADQSVHIARKNLGRELAREHPISADVVIGVPDSSLAAASGYAEESGLPYEVGLVKNRYIGRTFIRPTQEAREQLVLFNLNAVRKVVEGRRVVLVDDSIVRGTTSIRLLDLLRSAGARDVHMRISSPPYLYGCPYGLDAAEEHQLVARGRSEQDIAALIGADSVRFLSPEGMLRAFGAEGGLAAQLRGTYGPEGKPSEPAEPADRTDAKGQYCLACFLGRFPVPPGSAGRASAEGHVT